MVGTGKRSTALVPLRGTVCGGVKGEIVLDKGWDGMGTMLKVLAIACTVIIQLYLLCSNLHFKDLICASGKMPIGSMCS